MLCLRGGSTAVYSTSLSPTLPPSRTAPVRGSALMNTLPLPTARGHLAPGLLATLYLCLCFLPLGTRLPFSLTSLRLWTLAIVLLLAAAFARLLQSWRHGRWLLLLAVAGHCLASPVLFSEITFHLLGLCAGLLLALAIAAGHAGRRLEAALWLLSALLSWVYQQPLDLPDGDAVTAALDAYGLPLLGTSVVAHLILLGGARQGLAYVLNRAFIVLLGFMLFSHLSGFLPLGSARQWLWLVALSLTIDVLFITQLLASPRSQARWLGWTLVVVLASQPLLPRSDDHYHYPGGNSLSRQLAQLPPSEILVQAWARAVVGRYRELEPALAKHHFQYAASVDSLFALRHGQAFYLLGAPLDLQRNASGLDATVQNAIDHYRCRYTWSAAISEASLLHLNCG